MVCITTSEFCCSLGKLSSRLKISRGETEAVTCGICCLEYHTFKKNIFEELPSLRQITQKDINMQNNRSGIVSFVDSRLLIIYIGLFYVTNAFCE